MDSEKKVEIHKKAIEDEAKYVAETQTIGRRRYEYGGRTFCIQAEVGSPRRTRRCQAGRHRAP